MPKMTVTSIYISIADQDRVNYNISDVLQKKNVKIIPLHISRYICQNYSSKQEVGQPLANKNLAIVFDQFFIDDLSEDELNSIVDMYP